MHIIDLHFQVGAKPLLCGLNAHFSPGIISISGENGSGKSTLLRILSGLCEPDKGKISYQGQELYAQPTLKKIIGYVQSQPFLYPHLTLMENMQVVAAMRQINPKALHINLNEVLNQCQLTAHVNQLFGKCSDGLQKRAMLASALLDKPRLLILDEPCSGLSPKSRSLLWQILKALHKTGTDIILSSHLEEVTTFCQQSYVLENGQLHLQTTPSRFSEIVLTQNVSEVINPSQEANL
ncbi:MAG: ABC transporter ATP-binding protein [Proteobacteria bacterium]|nr:ABC transporter ATP-binding protein [Pseudomonadota bacterium]